MEGNAYNKFRLQNLRERDQMMRQLGLRPPSPVSTLRGRSRTRRERSITSSERSITPSERSLSFSERSVSPVQRRRGRPPKRPQVVSPDSEDGECTRPKTKRKRMNSLSSSQSSTSVATSTSIRRSIDNQDKRYPLRERTAGPVYKDIYIPGCDDMLYCADCKCEWEGECPEHGPLLVIEDTPVPPDINDTRRARRTAPSIISLADSKIPKAGTGVWAREFIPARVRFGPYGGQVASIGVRNEYSWLIRKNGRPHHTIDASEPGLSNWMRYVNCARYDGEQNLDAFQFGGDIYYRTIRRIQPHEELLVWYGNEYGKQLGINPKICDASDEQKWREMRFQCSGCGFSYISPLYLERHQKACRQLKNVEERGLIHQCPGCQFMYSDYEYLKRHKRFCRKLYFTEIEAGNSSRKETPKLDPVDPDEKETPAPRKSGSVQDVTETKTKTRSKTKTSGPENVQEEKDLKISRDKKETCDSENVQKRKNRKTILTNKETRYSENVQEEKDRKTSRTKKETRDSENVQEEKDRKISRDKKETCDSENVQKGKNRKTILTNKETRDSENVQEEKDRKTSSTKKETRDSENVQEEKDLKISRDKKETCDSENVQKGKNRKTILTNKETRDSENVQEEKDRKTSRTKKETCDSENVQEEKDRKTSRVRKDTCDIENLREEKGPKTSLAKKETCDSENLQEEQDSRNSRVKEEARVVENLQEVKDARRRAEDDVDSQVMKRCTAIIDLVSDEEPDEYRGDHGDGSPERLCDCSSETGDHDLDGHLIDSSSDKKGGESDASTMSLPSEDGESGSEDTAQVACTGTDTQSPRIKRCLVRLERISGLPGRPLTVTIYKCTACDERFVDKRELVLHSELHRSEIVYLCGQCEKTFESQQLLDDHASVHGESNECPRTPPSGTSCRQSFSIKDDFAKHTCDAARKDELGLETRMEYEHVVPLVADYSDEPDATTEPLPSNADLEMDETYFDEGASADLEEASTSQTDAKPVKLSFPCKDESRTNAETADVSETGAASVQAQLEYECHRCGVQIVGLKRLMLHLVTHKEGDRLVRRLFDSASASKRQDSQSCVFNGDKMFLPATVEHFSLSHSLTTSLSVKLNEEQISVESTVVLPGGDGVSNKSGMKAQLPLSGSLNSYLRRRRGNFVCSDCSARFSIKSMLVIHRRIHQGQEPFVCKHCNHSFLFSHSFQQHVRIHKTDKLAPKS